MRKKTLQYYKQGYNCSQCILKACEQKYGLQVSKQCYQMCATVNKGFGLGGMCSVLIAGIMVFGLMFDEPTARSLRMELLARFQEKHPNMNCAALKKERGRSSNCEELVGSIADIIDELIMAQGY